MIKISILRDGILTHGAKFESQELADAWLAKHEANGTFGPKSELIPAVVDENGVELVPATYVEGYSVVIEDISDKVAQEKANAEALKFLNDTDFKVIRHLDQQNLGIATSLTAEEFQELLHQRQMAREAIVK
jgi:hypothetical protein